MLIVEKIMKDISPFKNNIYLYKIQRTCHFYVVKQFFFFQERENVIFHHTIFLQLCRYSSLT